MRLLQWIIIAVILTSCQREDSIQQYLLKEPYWITHGMAWHWGEIGNHGNGEVLYFAPDGAVKRLRNDFYNVQDTIRWGEPGIVLQVGQWEVEAGKVITSLHTIHRTFTVVDSLGQPVEAEAVEVDTFQVDNQQLISRKNHYQSVKNLSSELQSYLEKNPKEQ
jgi:hypothetical protein